MYNRFDRLLDYSWLLIGQVFEIRPNNRQHEYIVFSVHALDLKMIQESEDTTRSRMRPRPGREMTVNLDLVVPVGKFSHGKLECHVSTTWES